MEFNITKHKLQQVHHLHHLHHLQRQPRLQRVHPQNNILIISCTTHLSHIDLYKQIYMENQLNELNQCGGKGSMIGTIVVIIVILVVLIGVGIGIYYGSNNIRHNLHHL